MAGFIAAMANPIQQGLKPDRARRGQWSTGAAMANPIQQGLKHFKMGPDWPGGVFAAMANPIQQGLKLRQP